MTAPLFKIPGYWKKVVLTFLSTLFVCFSICIYLFSSGDSSHDRKMNKLAENGKLLWNKNNCTACHQLYGLGGYLGPDLTNFISRPGKGPAYANAILKGGIGIMPAFQMDSTDISALMEYFRYLDSTGNFPGDGSPKNKNQLVIAGNK